MKIFVKLVLFLLVLALAAPFFLRGPDGGPLISFDDVQKTDGGFGKGFEKVEKLFSGLKSPYSDQSQEVLDRNPSQLDSFQVYQWKDEHGKWHFSDERNPAGESEVKTVVNDAMIVEMDNKALLEKLEKIYNSNPLDGKSDKGGVLDFPELLSGNLSLKEILSTFEKAKEVQGVMDARNEQQIRSAEAL